MSVNVNNKHRVISLLIMLFLCLTASMLVFVPADLVQAEEVGLTVSEFIADFENDVNNAESVSVNNTETENTQIVNSINALLVDAEAYCVNFVDENDLFKMKNLVIKLATLQINNYKDLQNGLYSGDELVVVEENYNIAIEVVNSISSNYSIFYDYTYTIEGETKTVETISDFVIAYADSFNVVSLKTEIDTSVVPNKKLSKITYSDENISVSITAVDDNNQEVLAFAYNNELKVKESKSFSTKINLGRILNGDKIEEGFDLDSATSEEIISQVKGGSLTYFYNVQIFEDGIVTTNFDNNYFVEITFNNKTVLSKYVGKINIVNYDDGKVRGAVNANDVTYENNVLSYQTTNLANIMIVTPEPFIDYGFYILIGLLVLIVIIIILTIIIKIIKGRKVKIVFYLAKNKVYQVVKTKVNKEFVMPKDPNRKNLIFQGWFTDKSYKYRFALTKVPTKKTVEVYAKWIDLEQFAMLKKQAEEKDAKAKLAKASEVQASNVNAQADNVKSSGAVVAPITAKEEQSQAVNSNEKTMLKEKQKLEKIEASKKAYEAKRAEEMRKAEEARLEAVKHIETNKANESEKAEQVDKTEELEKKIKLVEENQAKLIAEARADEKNLMLVQMASLEKTNDDATNKLIDEYDAKVNELQKQVESTSSENDQLQSQVEDLQKQLDELSVEPKIIDELILPATTGETASKKVEDILQSVENEFAAAKACNALRVFTKSFVKLNDETIRNERKALFKLYLKENKLYFISTRDAIDPFKELSGNNPFKSVLEIVDNESFVFVKDIIKDDMNENKLIYYPENSVIDEAIDNQDLGFTYFIKE